MSDQFKFLRDLICGSDATQFSKHQAVLILNSMQSDRDALAARVAAHVFARGVIGFVADPNSRTEQYWRGKFEGRKEAMRQYDYALQTKDSLPIETFTTEMAAKCGPPTAEPAPVTQGQCTCTRDSGIICPACMDAFAVIKQIESQAAQDTIVCSVSTVGMEALAAGRSATVFPSAASDGTNLVRLSALEAVRAEKEAVEIKCAQHKDAAAHWFEMLGKQEARTREAERALDAYKVALNDVPGMCWDAIRERITNRVAEILGETK